MVPLTGEASSLRAAPASAGAPVVVSLSEREFRVYEALQGLVGPREVWSGTQQDLGDEAGYDERTVRPALRGLARKGLVSVTVRGRTRIYRLLSPAPDGAAFEVRREADERSGRDVVRAAGSGRARSEIDALLARLRASGGVPNEGGSGRITADREGAGMPDQTGSGAPVSRDRTMSSSSSASGDPPSSVIPPVRPAGEAGPAGDEVALPPGWESVAEALALRLPLVDPTPELVVLLAAHPREVWEAAVTRAMREPPVESPLYVERCLETVLRLREAERLRLERATSAPSAPSEPVAPAPAAAPAPSVSVSVRPVAGQVPGVASVLASAGRGLVRSAARALVSRMGGGR